MGWKATHSDEGNVLDVICVRHVCGHCIARWIVQEMSSLGEESVSWSLEYEEAQ